MTIPKELTLDLRFDLRNGATPLRSEAKLLCDYIDQLEDALAQEACAARLAKGVAEDAAKDGAKWRTLAMALRHRLWYSTDQMLSGRINMGNERREAIVQGNRVALQLAVDARLGDAIDAAMQAGKDAKPCS